MVPFLTYLIIGITLLLSYTAWKNNDKMRQWIFNPYSVEKYRQYQRFLTSGFIHADTMHLLFNMLTFYFFADYLELYYRINYGAAGIAIFLGIYLLGIIISSIPSYLKHRHNAAYNSLGASGGVASILFAFIIIEPTSLLYIFGIIPVPGFILGILYMIYSYHAGKNQYDRVNHDAHFWGAAFGVIASVLIDPSVLVDFVNEIANWNPFS